MKETLYSILLKPLGPPNWPIQVKILLLFSLLFLAVAFLLFLFILISRIMDVLVSRRALIMNKKAQEMIMSFLFHAEEWEEESLMKFRNKHLRTKFLRQVYLDNLIILHKNIVGESSVRLRSLYVTLGLKAHSLNKLKSRSWARAAKGIAELAEMGSSEDIKFIRSFINHKNSIMRSQAQVALLKLEVELPFSFLDELKEPLSEWQQTQLAHAAERSNTSKLPDFTRWLHAKEASHRVFCIRMIAQFGCYEAAEEMLDLLKHPFPPATVRKEIVLAIRQLELYQAETSLRQLHPYETPEIELEIEKTLKVIAVPGMSVEPALPEKENRRTDILLLHPGSQSPDFRDEEKSLSASA